VSDLGIGILVGGHGSRLGGAAKGLLALPDGTRLIDRLVAVCLETAPRAPVYLLGTRSEYGALGLPRLADDPPNIGPLGGLHALLRQPHEQVLLLGCDLPFLSAKLLLRVLAPTATSAVAVQSGNPPRWEPMVSRYCVAKTLPEVRDLISRGNFGLFSLLDRLNATPLSTNPEEQHELQDWDTPEDVERCFGAPTSGRGHAPG
jgi:molybdopterin-guanine dinucleotide biosynthesis protein A